LILLIKTVLVTGGAGFIGSHLVRALLKKGKRVVVVDNMNNSYDPRLKRENLALIAKTFSPESQSDFIFIEKEIHQLSVTQILTHVKSVDAVIHLAAMAGVRASIASPFLYEEINALGTLTLLETARSLNVRKFILSSSSSVYGINPNVPWVESDALLLPISPYAASKISAELHCRVYSHLYDMNCIVLRLFTVYGPRQRPDLAISKFIAQAYRDEVINLYGDGSSARDYTFVEDIVNGFVAALEKDIPGFEIFNLGNCHPISLLSLIAAIENAMGKQLKIKQLPMQLGDVPTTFADIRKAQSILGYNPQTELNKGIRIQVRSFLSAQKHFSV
jgi:UDP-glucuronate 4-epimerase